MLWQNLVEMVVYWFAAASVFRAVLSVDRAVLHPDFPFSIFSDFSEKYSFTLAQGFWIIYFALFYAITPI